MENNNEICDVIDSVVINITEMYFEKENEIDPINDMIKTLDVFNGNIEPYTPKKPFERFIGILKVQKGE